MNEEYNDNQVKSAAADRLATAALVLGIISLFSTLCCCPFVFSAIGIILALLSKGAEQYLRPRAKTGLILSITGMVVSVIIIAFTIGFPLFMFKTNPQYRKEMIKTYEESLKENEEMFRQTYGDEFYQEIEDFLNQYK